MTRHAVVLVVLFFAPLMANAQEDPFGYGSTYHAECAVCHGEQMEGAAQGPALVGRELTHGDTMAALVAAIASGYPERGMPGWSDRFDTAKIKQIALSIAEARAGFDYRDFQYAAELEIPATPIESELGAFRLEPFASGIDPLPFSMVPLPDGRLLVTERKRGLRVISIDGAVSDLIEGTPRAYADTYIIAVAQEWGNGWMQGLALHPDYDENGWIYLQYGDRCEDCNAISRRNEVPVSMNTIVRGRLEGNRWVDEETIWTSPKEYYGIGTDLGRGGRLSFDDTGHLFFSVGLGNDNFRGVQDLATPWGKIHRIRDDGTIPPDNPFATTEGAMASIWTYGHRSPQGLEFRETTGELWGTEMGPRGGDEVNRLLPGRNYGWPLTSKGLNYNGSPVDYGPALGITPDLDAIEQPVVDLTPSPAVSSFVFYHGDAFSQWDGHLLVGSLKGRSLYRIVLDGDTFVHQETLIEGLARIRDIEIGPGGLVYLLLENNAGSRIVKMLPIDTPP